MTLYQAEYLEKLQLIERKNNMQASIFNRFFSIIVYYELIQELIFYKKVKKLGSLSNILMTPHLMTIQMRDGYKKKLMKMEIKEN